MVNTLDSRETSASSQELRDSIQKVAKDFKASWIELGRYLYTVYQDKLYREWGYREFETYCQKEVGIRIATAQKMLRSYNFLEREEPRYVERDRYEKNQASKVPDYESVNVLRLAHGKKLEEDDYAELRNKVLDEASPVQAVRQQYRSMMEAANEDSPQEAREKKRNETIRRYLSTLKSLHREISVSKILPEKQLRKFESSINDIEAELKAHLE